MATDLDDLDLDDPILIRLGNPERWRYARMIEPGQDGSVWVDLIDTRGLARQVAYRIEVPLADVRLLARLQDPRVPPPITPEYLTILRDELETLRHRYNTEPGALTLASVLEDIVNAYEAP